MKKHSFLNPLLFGVAFAILGIVEHEKSVICLGGFFIVVATIGIICEQIKKKRKKCYTSISIELETKMDDKESVAVHREKWVRGKIKLIFPKYQMIEKAIHILEQNDFVFSLVETGGESSSHMWSMGFDREYHTVQEFFEKAEKEYEIERNKSMKDGGPSIEWESTSFVLINNSRDIKIDISIEEDNGKANPKYATYSFGGIKHILEYDKSYAEMIKEKLEILNQQ